MGGGGELGIRTKGEKTRLAVLGPITPPQPRAATEYLKGGESGWSVQYMLC